MPLVIVLLTYALHNVIGNTVTDYKQTINNDYSIMIITSLPVTKNDISSVGDIKVKKITEVDKAEIINSLKERLSDNSLKLLKHKLPYFYQVYLEQYPTTSQLKIINKELSKLPNVKNVEIFASDHNQIYSLLVLIEQVVQVILLFIIIFALLILSKQVKIWMFEHSQRIDIIQYHGGSIFYSALPIIKIALFGAMVANIIVVGIIFIVGQNLSLFISAEIFGILTNTDGFTVDFLQIIILSFVISIISTISVLIKYKLR